MLGHLMIAWNYVGYVAVWRAVGRMLRGRTNWDKTSRTNEAAERRPEQVAVTPAILDPELVPTGV